MKKLKWFKSFNCTQLDIIKYKSVSDDKSDGWVTLKDNVIIKTIMERISALPSDGDEKIKWGAKAKRTLLSFNCGPEDFQNIEIFDKKFKTPSLGFNSEKNEIEEQLAEDLIALADPQLGSRILKFQNHRVEFKNFSVTFIGGKNTPQPKNGPTIGPTNENFYEINTMGSGNSMTIKIFDGQVPPQPFAFVANGEIYYLITYSYKNWGLYPNYFVVSDKLEKR